MSKKNIVKRIASAEEHLHKDFIQEFTKKTIAVAHRSILIQFLIRSLYLQREDVGQHKRAILLAATQSRFSRTGL
ncbi:hypothetical protein QE152_g23458 [Popillia japonica]|uniref:Uncharacterized protein n=1 Tax=Popillia japonica TaxID=7064 RepID=A0AAW1KFJ8_POPJA